MTQAVSPIPSLLSVCWLLEDHARHPCNAYRRSGAKATVHGLMHEAMSYQKATTQR